MSEVKEEVKVEAAAPAIAEKKEYKPRSTEPKTYNKAAKSKKRSCLFCQDKKAIDYKDIVTLKKFVGENAKINPRRQTGVCAVHQRELTKAIKTSRKMALMPYKGE